MTTFTITCRPTVAGTTFASTLFFTSSESALENIDGSFPSYAFTESQILMSQADSRSNIIYTKLEFQADTNFFPEDGGGGNEVFWTELNITDAYIAETQSWDGARTLVSNTSFGNTRYYPGQQVNDDILNTTIIWTSESTTSSQTTTTETATVYETSFTDTTNVTTRTGTVVQTGTMTAPEPRTTATQTQGFTTRTAELSTTRVTTTTREDDFSHWRAGEGGSTHRGVFQSATVVVLETLNLGTIRPEIGWVVTNRPVLTLTFSSVVEEQSLTQFTVFPSFQKTFGHVEEGTWTVFSISSEDASGFVSNTTPDFSTGFTFSTRALEIETPTTYTTTATTGTTISVASLFTSIPSPLNQQIGTTLTTQSWGSTIRETLYLGGDISETTLFSETTHQNRIGTVTWNATHRQSTTFLSSFTFKTAYMRTSSGEIGLDTDGVPNGDSIGQSGYTETQTITFERPISVAASNYTPFISQNQCGSSLSFAVAAASNVSEAAQSLAAGGVSVQELPLFETIGLVVDVARTARALIGTWSYVTEGTSVTASAGPSGLSATSASGPSSSIVTKSTEGAWQLQEDAISRANLSGGQRINLGGTPPTGAATAFYNAGVFSTTGAEGSGTIVVTKARTESIAASAQRTAYVPASGVFVSAGSERYSTTGRNLTALIQETAIITNRNQLVL